MTISYHAAEGTLREGDGVKFRCDAAGRPVFSGSHWNDWNRGTVTKVMGRNNPLYFMSFNLLNGEKVSVALNAKNWPVGMGKVIREVVS